MLRCQGREIDTSKSAVESKEVESTRQSIANILSFDDEEPAQQQDKHNLAQANGSLEALNGVSKGGVEKEDDKDEDDMLKMFFGEQQDGGNISNLYIQK